MIAPAVARGIRGAHLRDLAHGKHSSEEISQRWRAIGDIVSDLGQGKTNLQKFKRFFAQ